MELTEAVEFIRPAVSGEGGTWADFGAGEGTFTRALAMLTGPHAQVLAIDRDPRALQSFRDPAQAGADSTATVVPVSGDFRHLESIRELAGLELDGALFANSLHFTPDADLVLVRVARILRPGGRIVVVEYDGRPPSRWIPHPISIDRLRVLAARAELDPPVVVGERPSEFGGMLYCAVAPRRERRTE